MHSKTLLVIYSFLKIVLINLLADDLIIFKQSGQRGFSLSSSMICKWNIKILMNPHFSHKKLWYLHWKLNENICDFSLNFFLADGITYSFGIFITNLIEVFGSDRGATSLIVSILVGVTLGSGMHIWHLMSHWMKSLWSLSEDFLMNTFIEEIFWWVCTFCDVNKWH